MNMLCELMEDITHRFWKNKYIMYKKALYTPTQLLQSDMTITDLYYLSSFSNDLFTEFDIEVINTFFHFNSNFIFGVFSDFINDRILFFNEPNFPDIHFHNGIRIFDNTTFLFPHENHFFFQIPFFKSHYIIALRTQFYSFINFLSNTLFHKQEISFINQDVDKIFKFKHLLSLPNTIKTRYNDKIIIFKTRYLLAKHTPFSIGRYIPIIDIIISYLIINTHYSRF